MHSELVFDIKMKRTLLTLTTALLIMGCSNKENEKVPAFSLSNLDTTVLASADFYQYATGGWQKLNPLKPEYASYGSFNVLDENNQIQINELFKEMSNLNPEKGTVEQKIVDLYKMGLDSIRLNNEGAAPIVEHFNEILSINDKDGILNEIAFQIINVSNPFYSFYVDADLNDSKMNILYFEQSGLGMGNRDYYLESKNAELKAGYKAFLEKVFTLAGADNAAAMSESVLKVEDAIAEYQWSNVENRNLEKMNNPMSSQELFAAYPNLNLDVILAKAGIADQKKLIVMQNTYFEKLNKWFATADVNDVKAYLAAKYVRAACSYLSDDFRKAAFEFFSKQMSGAQEEHQIWKRAMSVPNSLLGEAVGKMYVEKYFSAQDKERMLEMITNLKASLSDHIANLEWMSDETKAKAQEKLAAFTVKIGYPDKWKDYSTLEIDPSMSYFQNVMNANAWYTEDNLSKVGQPVDKTLWAMTPQTVNAYYNPLANEICFPAAILMPPFYNRDADDAINYGAIGVVISHEMTHGFDDQGRLFDKDGNMTDWWTEADAEAFKAKTAVLVEQFNKVEVLPGTFANGQFSLGENIADQGGLRIAYDAYQKSLNGTTPEPIDGFTGNQRFYLGYAQVWAQNITDQEKERRTNIDEHSLAENRVNVTLKNIQTFFDAFGIKEGDPMFRPESERIVIW